jgi:histidine triad (HIT) family protein
MSEPSIYTRIIKGELPSHKVYEDDSVIAIMNIHPTRPGNVLVIPKVQVAYLHQLDEENYAHLMRVVQKVMQREAEVFGDAYKICLKVMGFDIAHIHVHVVPCKTPEDFFATEDMNEPDHEALAVMAAKLAIQ